MSNPYAKYLSEGEVLSLHYASTVDDNNSMANRITMCKAATQRLGNCYACIATALHRQDECCPECSWNTEREAERKKK